MKKLWISILLAIGIFLCLGNTTAHTASPDVDTIMKKMKQLFEPEKTTTRTVTITLWKGKTKTMQWVAREARKKIGDDKNYLLVFMKPEDMKGIARLIVERKDKDNVEFLYIPAINRVREIFPVMAYDTFLNTDFTYADIGFLNVEGVHKLLGEEEHLGKKVYKVETVPKIKWYYGRIITWVSADNYLPIERDYYDTAGRLWKKQTFKKVTVFNEIPTPVKICMEDLQMNTRTEYEVSAVCYGSYVPDDIFSLENLKQSLEAEFCQIKPAK